MLQIKFHPTGYNTLLVGFTFVAGVWLSPTAIAENVPSVGAVAAPADSDQAGVTSEQEAIPSFPVASFNFPVEDELGVMTAETPGTLQPFGKTGSTMAGAEFTPISLAEKDRVAAPFFADKQVHSPLEAKINTKAADLKIPEPSRSLVGDTLPPPTEVAQTPDDNKAPTSPALAQASSDAARASLQQQSQNPIANLISVPFQQNFNFGVGPFDETQYVLNIQPVIPTPLSKKLLLVSRIIIPVINQPTVGVDPITSLPASGSTFGLGDINPQFFLVPQTGSNVTWGVGPVFLLPTAANEALGSGKWGAGPTGVLVVTSGKWLYGALANQIWSFAGDQDRSDVSSFLVQPFINYSLPDGWTVGTAPSITANWNADKGDKWTVPIGASVSKLLTINKQPVTLGLSGFYNVVRPSFGGEWTLRMQFTLLFPTKSR